MISHVRKPSFLVACELVSSTEVEGPETVRVALSQAEEWGPQSLRRCGVALSQAEEWRPQGRRSS